MSNAHKAHYNSVYYNIFLIEHGIKMNLKNVIDCIEKLQ